MKKVFTIAIALSALGLVLAGCSSGAAEGESKPAETAGGTAGGAAEGEGK